MWRRGHHWPDVTTSYARRPVSPHSVLDVQPTTPLMAPGSTAWSPWPLVRSLLLSLRPAGLRQEDLKGKTKKESRTSFPAGNIASRESGTPRGLRISIGVEPADRTSALPRRDITSSGASAIDPSPFPGAVRVSVASPPAARAEPNRWMAALDRWAGTRTGARLADLNVVVVMLVGLMDYVSGPQFSLGILYMVPVCYSAWFAGKRHGFIISSLAGLVWLGADVASVPGPLHFGAILWNVAARTAIFCFVVLMLDHIRALHLGLGETVAQRTQELRAETARGMAMEREIAVVSHREQRRIAHELHDNLGQELGALAFQAKLLASRLQQSGTNLSREAEVLVTQLNKSTARTRALSHLLDPVGDVTGGLYHALSELADQSGRAFAIACTFDSPEQLPQLCAEAELNLYRITQEAIHNAAKHGRATRVVICAAVTPDCLTLAITDNGCGLASPGNKQAAADPALRGMGMRIMRYRAASLGARLDIHSQPGHGCSIVCSVPLSVVAGASAPS